MTSATVSHPPLAPSRLNPAHPVCRAEHYALVFCGSIERLGELPGEPAALTPRKYAMIDPALPAHDDFARTPGMPLPLWPAERVEPIDGVCFIFTRAEHPLIEKLCAAGAQKDEHFVIVDQRAMTSTADDVRDPECDLNCRLGDFVRALPATGWIALLGYGHQGQRIAQLLVERFSFDCTRIRVIDSSPQSLALAAAADFDSTDASDVADAAAVIYSPLMTHAPLVETLETARAAGLMIFDNRHRPSDLRQFTPRGDRIFLDGPAARLLAVQGTTLTIRQPSSYIYNSIDGIAVAGMVVRTDRRMLSGVTFPHLHGGQPFVLGSCGSGGAGGGGSARSIDLKHQSPFDPLAASTFGGLISAHVSLRCGAETGFFAARELCRELWPDATEAIFPAQHAIDLGATDFERLLRAHLDCREIVPAMLTPAQRVVLGVAARHYAADRPIIEIGSALGGSALLMAAATVGGRPTIWSIDPEASTRDIMRFAFEREGHRDRLTQIVKPSADAATELAHLRGEAHGVAGLVFIDGLHTLAGVASDFDLYAPLLAPGGALLVHDACPQIHSVLRVVIERMLPDPRFEAKCLVDGLMVLERR